MQTTLDGLLNKRVALEQPAKGYRVAVDTVLLAAAIQAQPGQRVLDLGCGVGGAMLCLAARVPGLSIAGIEIQPELAEIARRNIARNNFDARMDVMEGDVKQIIEKREKGEENGNSLFSILFSIPNPGFAHVMMNPPYYDEATHDVSPNASKRIANTEKDGDLELWLSAAERALAGEGSLTVIHRAGRQSELLSLMSVFCARLEILPILPRLGAAPRRILVRGQKKLEGCKSAERNMRCKPLILHGTEGGYTLEVEALLRHGKSLLYEAE